ncbi:hypothetical protein E4U40_001705 [Claviceps sp. LM458 group G5]|nr:hypothetical protein E4U40_001705 [Claviceps sp. LM458 group G5]KAG6047958.1 hypothetical protein E4U39_007889 [Claviceps sp. Clav50 group G5]
MPLGGILPYCPDAEELRRLKGPTEDEILLMEAIRVAQVEAGKKLFNEIKAKEKKAKEDQERKAAKAREEKAARARAQKEAEKALDKKIRMGHGLTRTHKKSQGKKFVSLPSGLTMSRSALAETRQRANSQFGGGPKADTKNQKGKDKAPTKFSLHGDTAKGVKRTSPAIPRRTSLSSRLFCLC